MTPKSPKMFVLIIMHAVGRKQEEFKGVTKNHKIV